MGVSLVPFDDSVRLDLVVPFDCVVRTGVQGGRT